MRIRSIAIIATLALAGCGSVTEDQGTKVTSGEQTTTSAPSSTPTGEAAEGTEDSGDTEFELGIREPEGAVDEATPNSPDSDAGLSREPADDAEDSSDPKGGAGLKLAPANPGFLLGEEFTVGDETFQRLVLPDDYNIDTFNTLIEHSNFTLADEDVLDAIYFTTRFATEELATSELAFNYTEESAKAWMDDHAHIFVHPGLAEQGLLNTENPNDSLALLYTNNGWDRGNPQTKSRVMNLEANILSLDETNDSLVIIHKVKFESTVSGLADFEGSFIEETKLVATYEVQQVDGEWKIADYSTSWETEYK